MRAEKVLITEIKYIERIYLIVLPLFLIQSCSSNNITKVYKNNKQEAYQVVSINDLVTKPEQYANTTIEITGIYKSAVEESALYSSNRSLNDKDVSKALWLRFDIGFPLYKNRSNINLLDSYKEFEKIDRKKVTVRGKFYPKSKGHLSSFFGTIGNIFYLEVSN